MVLDASTAVPVKKDNNAWISFWFGMLSVIPFIGAVLGIVAIVFGIISISKIKYLAK